MLLRLQVMQVQHFLRRQGRQHLLIFFTGPDSIEPRELEVGTVCPEDILSGRDIDTDGIKDSRSHKTGDKAAPDKVIQFKLLCTEVRFDDLRSQGDIGWADCFMGILGGGFSLTSTSLSDIGLPIFRGDVAFDFCLCLIRDAR